MFELALKAGLPVVGVVTDDPVNFPEVLRYYAAPRHVREYAKQVKSLGPNLYWTKDAGVVDEELVEHLQDGGYQLVVVNPDKPTPLVFDAGTLPTPEVLVRKLLLTMVGEKWVEVLLPVLRGLSLRAVREVMLLTQARAGNALPQEIQRTRASMFVAGQGLYLEDATYDFYVWPKALREWVDVNVEYFRKKVHPKLVPRGLLVEGPPGVGKSTSAKAVANEFQVPLYRFDASTALDKFVGVSEARVAKILAFVDREAPCVLLLDEVEKVFKSSESTDVIPRLLSQILWWLAEHQSRVFTVMTTNDRASIPPEMYRPGRVDMVLRLGPLSWQDALHFASMTFQSVVGEAPKGGHHKVLRDALQQLYPGEFEPSITHADVISAVLRVVKEHKYA